MWNPTKDALRMRHGLTDCGKEVLRSCREEGSPLPHKIRQTFGVRDGALGILVRSTLVVLVPWSPSTSRTGAWVSGRHHSRWLSQNADAMPYASKKIKVSGLSWRSTKLRRKVPSTIGWWSISILPVTWWDWVVSDYVQRHHSRWCQQRQLARKSEPLSSNLAGISKNFLKLLSNLCKMMPWHPVLRR